MSSAQLTLLKRTEMQGEALIIKSFLESQGIPAYIMDNTDVLNYVGFGGIRIMVAESDYERALDLINNHDFSIQN